MTRRSGAWRTGAVAIVIALGAATGLLGCSTEAELRGSRPSATATPTAADPWAPQPGDEPSAPTDPTGEPVDLTVGVYGPPESTRVIRRLSHRFARGNDQVASMTVQTWPDSAAAVASYDAGEVPDLFMVPLVDAQRLATEGRTQRVDQLLDQRGVSFSETYSRDSLQAFANDNGLQCLPYGISPMVLYVNRSLIDFEKMAFRGLEVPRDPLRWNWSQFIAAAEFSSRPRRNQWGFYVEPTLRQFAPFAYAAGVEIFDDPAAPSATALSSEESLAGLEDLRLVLADPRLRPTPAQARGRSAIDLFSRGRVGMILGFRDLTPQLRSVPGLEFDVMPIPSIDHNATVGDVQGICMSRETADPGLAADLMISVFSTEAIGRIARQGYLVPANVQVSQSDDFLQFGQEPSNAAIFNTGIPNIVMPPVVDDWRALDEVAAPYLLQFLNAPVLDLPVWAADVDEATLPVFEPALAE